MPPTNLMIVQGGGPTAVFNASLAQIVAEAQQQPGIAEILGARFGVQGLVQAKIADLGSLGSADLDLLRHTPGAALGSSRYQPTPAEMPKLVETLRRHDIGYLLFLGGNGTMRGAEIVSQTCRSAGLDIRVVGVPKTIDNDLAATDRCPGYASAARYLAVSTRELAADIRSLPQPVTILETMGRSVGWLAAATTLARTSEDVTEDEAPHLVYVPEVAFDQQRFLADLDRIVAKHGWAVVVVAEGIRHADGSMVHETADPGQADPLKRPMTGGVAQHLAGVVGRSLGIRCRSEKPGLLGRASMAHVACQDLEDAALVGRAGVRALAAGQSDVMVSLRPLLRPGEQTSPQLDSGYSLVPLSEAAGIEHRIPAQWLCDGPLPVAAAFREYLRPLVGELDKQMTELPWAALRTGAYSQ